MPLKTCMPIAWASVNGYLLPFRFPSARGIKILITVPDVEMRPCVHMSGFLGKSDLTGY